MMTFFLEGTKKIRELAASAHLKGSVTEALSYDSLENYKEHRIYKTGNNLKAPTVNETEQSVDNVRCLTLSDQKQRSWFERVLRPFTKEMGNSDEIERKNKATIIDHLEDLQIEYYKEKAKWMTQVDTLKQRISSLMSELQEVKKTNIKKTEQLNNLKTFYSQNQSVVGRNFDIDIDSQMMSVTSEKPTLSQQKNTIEKDHTDMTLACCTTNHFELKRNNEKTTSEKFLKFQKTKSRERSVSFKRIFAKKPLLRKIKSRNLLVPNDRKKLKLGNTDFQKKLDMEASRRNEALSLSEKFKGANPLIIKSPQLKHSPLKTTSTMSNENSSRETCDNCLKEHESSWKWATLGDDKNCIPILEKSSGVSLQGSIIKQQSQQFQEKLPLTTEISNADTRLFGNSLKRQKHEKTTNTLNESVSKVNKKGILLDFISQEGTVHCFEQKYKGHSKRLSRCPCRITIRSTWL